MIFVRIYVTGEFRHQVIFRAVCRYVGVVHDVLYVAAVQGGFYAFKDRCAGVRDVCVIPIGSREANLVGNGGVGMVCHVPRTDKGGGRPNCRPSVVPPVIPCCYGSILRRVSCLSFGTLAVIMQTAHSTKVPTRDGLEAERGEDTAGGVRKLVVRTFVITIPPSSGSSTGGRSTDDRETGWRGGGPAGPPVDMDDGFSMEAYRDGPRQMTPGTFHAPVSREHLHVQLYIDPSGLVTKADEVAVAVVV